MPVPGAHSYNLPLTGARLPATIATGKPDSGLLTSVLRGGCRAWRVGRFHVCRPGQVAEPVEEAAAVAAGGQVVQRRAARPLHEPRHESHRQTAPARAGQPVRTEATD